MIFFHFAGRHSERFRQILLVNWLSNRRDFSLLFCLKLPIFNFLKFKHNLEWQYSASSPIYTIPRFVLFIIETVLVWLTSFVMFDVKYLSAFTTTFYITIGRNWIWKSTSNWQKLHLRVATAIGVLVLPTEDTLPITISVVLKETISSNSLIFFITNVWKFVDVLALLQKEYL